MSTYEEEVRWVEGGVRTRLQKRHAEPGVCACGAALPAVETYTQHTMKDGLVGYQRVGGIINEVNGARVCAACWSSAVGSKGTR